MKQLSDVLEIRTQEGTEQFHSGNEARGYSLLNFWQWAYSDLLSNTSRGIIAEFIVAKALGIADIPRNAWTPYDLETTEGIKIEVKSAAYLQRWAQKDYSRISFGIQERRRWHEVTNTLDADSTRHADLYVFCLFAHKEKETLDILDLDQWQFYVMRTVILEKIGKRKTISLKNLQKYGVGPLMWSDLAKATIKESGAII